MDFGVRLSIQGDMGAPPSQIVDYATQMALRAEELGYDSAWVPDHVHNARVGPRGRGPVLESWTTMTALAMLTTKLRFAPHVLCNTFRNPALLAKMVATLDAFSRGRFITALGSGWFGAEALSYGWEWQAHDERAARAREATRVLKLMLTEPEVTFSGDFYRLHNAYLEPRPYTQPHPPIWVPGDSPATREIVAELGDVWLMYSKHPDTVAELRHDMRRRTDREIPIAVSAVFISGQPEEKAEAMLGKFLEERKHRFNRVITRDEVLAGNLIGDAEFCVERISQWIRAGVNYVVIQPMPPLEGMEYFASSVMPAFASSRLVAAAT